MKNLIALLVVILLFVTYCKGQQKEFMREDSSGFIHKDTTVNNNYAVSLIQQDNKPSFLTRYIIIEKQYYISEHSYGTKQQSMEKYGHAIVIVVNVKPGVVILTLPQLLEKYNLNKEYKDLSVFIDKQEFTHGSSIVAVPENVKSVEVLTDRETNKKFISIITTRYVEGDDTFHIGG